MTMFSKFASGIRQKKLQLKALNNGAQDMFALVILHEKCPYFSMQNSGQ